MLDGTALMPASVRVAERRRETHDTWTLRLDGGPGLAPGQFSMLYAFGARALGTTRVLALDGVCLRGKCETNPALGYQLLKLLASVFAQRLRDTRVRLLDLYGTDA